MKTADIIDAAFANIGQNQQSNGSFPSFSSSNPANYSRAKKYQTTFLTSLIGASLATLPQSEGRDKLLGRVANFLTAEASSAWSFNYWQRQSKETKNQPYPDDLDDTFCALSALFLFDPGLITGTALAGAVALLTAVEVSPGGPYRTWLVNSEAAPIWRDVDLVINCNVGYFLKLQNIHLPALNELVEQAIRAGCYTSPYYPDAFPAIYFLARFYTGKLRPRVVEQLFSWQEADGSWGTPLKTALSVSSLIRLGSSSDKLKRAVRYLEKTFLEGQWRAEAFCLDPSVEGKKHYAGSAALTTAFCLEALNLVQSKSTNTAVIVIDEEQRDFLRLLKSGLEDIGQKLPTNLRAGFRALSSKIIKSDQQIILLPLWFAKIIQLETNFKELVELSLANLFGWMAYTIYDDFFDGEGRVDRLPLANVCLRRMAAIFYSQSKDPALLARIDGILDRLDSANFWEYHSMRADPALPLKAWLPLKRSFPFARNADKSLGHALGPLILASKKEAATAGQLKKIENFFRAYLTARQINDDAHDWQEDLIAGRVTYVIQELLKDAAPKINDHSPAADAVPELQKIFWKKTIVRLMEMSLKDLKKAEELLISDKFFAEHSYINLITESVKIAAQKTLTEQARMRDFLKSYQA